MTAWNRNLEARGMLCVDIPCGRFETWVSVSYCARFSYTSIKAERLSGSLLQPFSIFYFYFTCILPSCVSIHHMHAWCWGVLEEGVGSPGSRVTVDYSSHVGAGNQTQVFCDSNKCSTAAPSIDPITFIWKGHVYVRVHVRGQLPGHSLLPLSGSRDWTRLLG